MVIVEGLVSLYMDSQGCCLSIEVKTLHVGLVVVVLFFIYFGYVI